MRVYALILILLSLTLAACGTQSSIPFAPISQLPDFLDEAEHEVREMYRFAIANRDDLTHYPCYCGCNGIGHMNLTDCFVAGLNANGTLKYDKHAQYCNICIAIARDVLRGMRAGKSPVEIRNQIDAQYASVGPSTDTPMPAH